MSVWLARWLLWNGKEGQTTILTPYQVKKRGYPIDIVLLTPCYVGSSLTNKEAIAKTYTWTVSIR